MVLTSIISPSQRWREVLLWWGVFLSCLIPLVSLVGALVAGQLGADPAKAVVDQLGTWAMNFLWISLSITPVRKLFGWRRPLVFRRMLGLYALFYALIHLLSVVALILGWRADLVMREVSERPYVIAGLLALLLLIPLGVTSTRNWQRRLGKRWKSLHRLVYPASLLVLLHFVWLIRASYAEAVFYTLVLAILLGIRLYLIPRR